MHNKCQYDIDKYSNFNTDPNRGDSIEGHELLQNSWLKENGYINNRNQGISRKNPAIGLTPSEHKAVTKMQRKAGLFEKEYLKSVSWKQNMIDNMNILKQVNIPRTKISEIMRETVKFGREYLED